MIAATSTLDAALLRAAIDTTFARRDTHFLPTTVPRPPGDWAVQYRRLAQEVGAPADLDSGYADASALLAPVLGGDTPSGTWNPAHQQWAQEASKS